MKIAIPVDKNEIETEVCMSYGRTPYFMIYNSDTKEIEFLDNSAAASQGGAGIKASQALADKEVSVVLTPRLGENAAEVLNAADIKIYKTTAGSAMDNIYAYINGELLVLTNIHPGFHNHGSK